MIELSENISECEADAKGRVDRLVVGAFSFPGKGAAICEASRAGGPMVPKHVATRHPTGRHKLTNVQNIFLHAGAMQMYFDHLPNPIDNGKRTCSTDELAIAAVRLLLLPTPTFATAQTIFMPNPLHN